MNPDQSGLTTCRRHLQHNAYCVHCAGKPGDVIWGENPTKYILVEPVDGGWAVIREADDERTWITDWQLTHFSIVEPSRVP